MCFKSIASVLHLHFMVITVYLPLRKCNDSWNLIPIFSTSKHTEYSSINQIDLQTVLPSCQHCLAFINLFNNVDLLPSTTPLLVRRLSPVIAGHIDFDFVPYNLAKKVNKYGSLVISKYNQSQSCVSKFFDIKTSVCTHILKSNFSMQIRPWNFEQYLYLLPQFYKNEMNNLWSYAGERSVKYIPNTILGIVVSEKLTDTLWSWAVSFRKSWRFRQLPRENIVILVKSLTHFEEQNQTFLFLPLCAQCSTVVEINVASLFMPLFKIQQEIDNALLKTTNISQWSLYGRPIENFNFMKECRDLIHHREIFKYNLDELLLCIKSKIIWKYILGTNFELVNAENAPQTNVEYFSGIDEQTMSFFIPHPLKEIRFLACGNTVLRTNENMYIFLKSFDYKLWIAIFVTFNLVVPIVWYLLQECNANYQYSSNAIVFDIFIAVFKNVFEQSTPYSSNLLNKQSLKILAGATLLCILVLSNAYKNENMYELMNPKKFQPFLHFKQLIEANYSIFALPVYMELSLYCNQNLTVFLTCLNEGFQDNHKIEVMHNKNKM